jgi:hypothetical protein
MPVVESRDEETSEARPRESWNGTGDTDDTGGVSRPDDGGGASDTGGTSRPGAGEGP